MSRPVPSSSPRVLLAELEGIGWGPLAGRSQRGVRDVLRVLAGMAPDGRVVITANELADRVGLCSKWTRSRLVILEGLGVIRWTRGYIEEGKPKPGFIVLVRSALIQIIRHAREIRRLRLGERARTTNQRIKDTVKLATLRTRKHRTPLSVQGEVSSILPLYKRQMGAAADAGRTPSQAVDSQPREENTAVPTICLHDLPINSCVTCRKTLQTHPDMDVRTLHKPQAPAGPAPKGWREGIRAAMRQAHHTQDELL